MSWLDAILGDMLKNLPPDAFSDRSGGLDDVARVIALLEKAIEENAGATTEAHRAVLSKAAADPFHSFVENPVFAPAGVEQWKAEMTFPRILRSSLLIAIYSHTEYLLLSWCESISKDPSIPQKFGKFKRDGGESYSPLRALPPRWREHPRRRLREVAGVGATRCIQAGAELSRAQRRHR